MRRARIKALATVPIRRKIVQDGTAINTSNTLEENTNVNNLPNAETIKIEICTDVIKVQEDTADEEHNAAKSTESRPATGENQDSQRLITEENKQDKNPEVNDQIAHKNASLLEVSTTINIDKAFVKEIGGSDLFISFFLIEVACAYVCIHLRYVYIYIYISIFSASPTKISSGRPCFMRPIPRLDNSGRIRKNSIQGSGASASESEDEHSRKTAPVTLSRERNDSICSVQSNKEGSVNDSQINSSNKSKTLQKRRVLPSESSRKLAEARREFLLKHENKEPDRNKLKMYDLIYYNPTTNPMTKKPDIKPKKSDQIVIS